MTRRRWLFGIAVVLALVVTLVWVVPAVAGPAVDCGPLDETACRRVVSRVIAEASEHTPAIPMPMTSISLSGSENCLSYSVFWLLGFGFVVNSLC